MHHLHIALVGGPVCKLKECKLDKGWGGIRLYAVAEADEAVLGVPDIITAMIQEKSLTDLFRFLQYRVFFIRSCNQIFPVYNNSAYIVLVPPLTSILDFQCFVPILLPTDGKLSRSHMCNRSWGLKSSTL